MADASDREWEAYRTLMEDMPNETWYAYREFSREVLGHDPGPLPNGEDVDMTERSAYKASGSVRATLPADMAEAFGVKMTEMPNGQSIPTRMFGTEYGLFMPWSNFPKNGERDRDR